LNEIVVTGVRGNDLEGLVGLRWGSESPLDDAVESFNAFLLIDTTVTILVDVSEDIFGCHLVSICRHLTAVGEV